MSVGPTFAQGPSDSLVLAWSAPEGCPDESRLRAEIDHLIATSERLDLSDLQVDGMLAPEANQWRLRVVIRVDGAEGIRELRGVSCVSLTRAAALIVALRVDPMAVAAAPVRPSIAEPEPTPASVQAAIVESAPALALDRESPPPVDRSAPPTEPTLASAANQEGGGREGQSAALRWDLSLAAFGVQGVLPGFGYGAQLGFGFGRHLWSVQLGARWLPGQEVTSALGSDQGARLRWGAGYLALGTPLDVGRFRLAPLFELEVGRLRGEAFGLSDARVGNSWWVALGASLSLSMRVKGNFGVFVAAGLQVPWRGFRFEINGSETLYRVSGAGFRSALGVDVYFP